ncbi:Endonuclease/Exonuclease/phosphatase family protein [Geodermatophilus obscurus]|uniref:Endonuclease/Exonuclease/phosphatase family protein n=1 Tax=Geodermatophilus obscurus TaxID=1861 RepID=A0A1I5DP14_9ACTN|nr:endonuclease/exonuclease/phosphatase family protein [Geodermatophilus obscurus]SFO00963.1 Endonuclease/Exonuclease/phosphatase family protein [Geodermatophilus obscurus]
MRIGTWNMEKYPFAGQGKGPEAAAFLASARVDLWLLTEVNAGWRTPGEVLVVSPRRVLGDSQRRWAGIQTALPSTPLPDDGRIPAAAEEALCLARVQLPTGSSAATVLVACSVLPWDDAAASWPGLPSGNLNDQARFVLDHHVDRIRRARRPGEPIIWGGDFNQALRRPTPELEQVGYRTLGTVDGIARLRTAFDQCGLRPLTEYAENRMPGREAIDHLAVSRELTVAGDVEVFRPPTTAAGTRLSDHAAYVADVEL